ncbi:glycosyltransferase [Stenotrophomonas maltophilia]|uniref:glycosyltransferase n=1 Tax=Stenotrophomonas maltophilia TaxID=40324 RepID=UPI0031F3309D
MGLPKDAFVVCSFGFMAPTKLNSRLVDAWLASSMAEDENCYLVFVGEPDSNDYGSALQKKILASSAAQRIRITGFASRDDFRAYLQCADAAVQLRTMSRGETSAAVLDALNHGLATVVNANGSMADLPDHTVLKLEDAFEDAALQHALESLYHDVERRQELALAGQRHVHQIHQPRRCADAYADAIEDFYAASGQGQQALLTELGGYLAHGGAAVDEAGLGQALAWNHPSRQSGRQALIDIDPGAGLLESPGGRAALQSLLLNPPAGWRIEPVSRKGGDSYRYARGAALELLGCPASLLRDEPVDVRAGDVLLGEGIEGSMAFQQLLWRGARFVPWSEHAGLFAPQGPGG